jgi:hypothetical protein
MIGIKRLRKFRTRHHDDTKFEGYTVEIDGLMAYNNWIYVPPNDKLRNLFLMKLIEKYAWLIQEAPQVQKMLKNESSRNQMKSIPLRLDLHTYSDHIFTSSNGNHM